MLNDTLQPKGIHILSAVLKTGPGIVGIKTTSRARHFNEVVF